MRGEKFQEVQYDHPPKFDMCTYKKWCLASRPLEGRAPLVEKRWYKGLHFCILWDYIIPHHTMNKKFNLTPLIFKPL